MPYDVWHNKKTKQISTTTVVSNANKVAYEKVSVNFNALCDKMDLKKNLTAGLLR